MRALPALLFDLDGTLVDSAQVIASAISIVAQDRGRAAVPVSEVRPLVSQGVAVLVGTSLGTSGDALADDISTFRTILASLKADREIIYPGVEAALTQFQAIGYRMAVVTNKPFFLAKKLMEEIGLIDFFEIIVIGVIFALIIMAIEITVFSGLHYLEMFAIEKTFGFCKQT